MTKKTILIFCAGYFPGVGYGGPVTSIANLSEALGNKFDIRIITSNHDLHSRIEYSGIQGGWNRIGLANVLYLNENKYKTDTFLKIISEYNEPVIYLSGIFNHRLNYPAILAAHKIGAKLILAPRGELCSNAIQQNYIKKKIYLLVMKLRGIYRYPTLYQATSPEEYYAIQKWLNIENNKIVCLDNIPRIIKTEVKSNKLEGRLKLLFISRIVPKKNLLELIAAANTLEYATTIDIYGPIEDVPYWEKCKKAIEDSPQNVKYTYCGAVSYSEVEKLYEKYDYFVLPTKSENYGHVIAEALQAGCPVIIPKSVTPWDSIDTIAGYTYELNNIETLSNILRNCACQDLTTHQQMIESSRAYAEKHILHNELIDKYSRLFGEQ